MRVRVSGRGRGRVREGEREGLWCLKNEENLGNHGDSDLEPEVLSNLQAEGDRPRPLMLELGVAPQVASATAATMTLACLSPCS